MLRSLLLASALILWLGCSVAGTPPTLEAPTPAEYGDGGGGPEAWSGSSEVASDWWTDFGDPLLSQFIVEGLEHNASLRAAAANVETAFAQARLDGAAGRPELEAALDPARRKQNTSRAASAASPSPPTAWR